MALKLERKKKEKKKENWRRNVTVPEESCGESDPVSLSQNYILYFSLYLCLSLSLSQINFLKVEINFYLNGPV